MKQIFVVKSDQTTVVESLSSIAPGQLYVLPLHTDGKIKDAFVKRYEFGIGQKNGHAVTLEVNMNSSNFTVNKVSKSHGSPFSGDVAIPIPTDNTNYTIVLVKKGTMTGERNTYTVTTFVKPGEVKSATQVAQDLVNQINNKLGEFGILSQLVTEGDNVSIHINNEADFTDWEIKAGDGLFGSDVTVESAEKPIGDKAYVEALVKYCAAGKGFNYLAEDGKELYPGYPEEVEAVNYVVYSLRFANPRLSSKQVDEQIWQELYIAVPTACTDVISDLDKLFSITSA